MELSAQTDSIIFFMIFDVGNFIGNYRKNGMPEQESQTN